MYLIGSIYFIPEMDALLTGTWIFIIGSTVIYVSQFLKLRRVALGTEKQWNFDNFKDDMPAFGVDLCAGAGGFAYMVGSIYFLPIYNVSDEIENLATNWFMVGGSLFLLSGVFLTYRYFCTLNYPH